MRSTSPPNLRSNIQPPVGCPSAIDKLEAPRSVYELVAPIVLWKCQQLNTQIADESLVITEDTKKLFCKAILETSLLATVSCLKKQYDLGKHAEIQEWLQTLK